MPTFFDQIMADTVRPAMRAVFGGTVSYVVAGVAVGVFTAQISPVEDVEAQDELGRFIASERTVTLSVGVADALNGMLAVNPSPSQHAVVIDGDTWPVHKVIQRTGSQAVLRLRKAPMLSRTRAHLSGRA